MAANAHSNYLLIIANSGRMLAQAAAKAGYVPLIIDLYDDLDTRKFAQDIHCVPSLGKKFLAPAINSLVKHYGVKNVIYGSGFEHFPLSLAYLAGRVTVWGNTSENFIQLNNKQLFFSRLKDLSIPFPEVCFTPPASPEGWVLKPSSGFGGFGISRFNGRLTNTPGYWQRYQPGQAHSVLFLANGVQTTILGFNRQWPVRLNDENAFVFSRIINSTDLTEEQKGLVSVWAGKLVAHYALKGLNSLDFIQYGPELYLLEVNPRLPASMQLYEGDLLTQHIKACQGELQVNKPAVVSVCGYQIIYANRPVRIPRKFGWPPCAMDIPKAGTLINTHQPICSIIARQNDSESVLRQLDQTQDFILNQLARL